MGFIDLYCERTTAAVWDEPLNAVSNLAFLIAAAIAWRARQTRGQGDGLEVCLIVLAALICVGSLLFHTFPFPWAERADVIPIWSFVALFIATVIWRMTGQAVAKTARILAIAGAITGAVFWLTSENRTTTGTTATGLWNGSEQYLPAALALVAFSLITTLRRHPAQPYVLAATLCFGASLVFRTVDPALCQATRGVGTHFLWHVLNGAMVGLLLLALIRTLPPATKGASEPP